jgi:hypothetical protein
LQERKAILNLSGGIVQLQEPAEQLIKYTKKQSYRLQSAATLIELELQQEFPKLFSDKLKNYIILPPVRTERLNHKILIDESKINSFKKKYTKVPDKLKEHKINFMNKKIKVEIA